MTFCFGFLVIQQQKPWEPLSQSEGQVATVVLCMTLQRTLNEIKMYMGERYYLHICKIAQDAKKLTVSIGHQTGVR